jgi:hypothetical protein
MGHGVKIELNIYHHSLFFMLEWEVSACGCSPKVPSTLTSSFVSHTCSSDGMDGLGNSGNYNVTSFESKDSNQSFRVSLGEQALRLAF